MDAHNFREFQVNFCSGGLALATAFAIMHPLDTLKTQIQTNSVNLRHLGRGFAFSFLMAAPQGGLRLSTYELTKSYLPMESDGARAASSAFAACVGDTFSSIVKVPREVVTARLQSGLDTEYLNAIKQKGGFLSGSSAYATANLVVQQNGVKGLFRGFWSTTIRFLSY